MPISSFNAFYLHIMRNNPQSQILFCNFSKIFSQSYEAFFLIPRQQRHNAKSHSAACKNWEKNHQERLI